MYTIHSIKQIETDVINQLHIPALVLMERAGMAVFNLLQTHYLNVKKIAIFCGHGNNGGDGYIVAALAKKANTHVTCFYLKDPLELKNPALSAYQLAKTHGVSLQPFHENLDLQEYDIIVDALLGTGFKGELQQDFLLAINKINHSKKPIISIDVPSGLASNTGYVAETAVKADYTLTMIGLKQGFFTADALDYCGNLTVADLDLPKDVFTKIKVSAQSIDFQQLKNNFLGSRKHNCHKGDFGHVAIIGGDIGMAGAIRMASEACARVGAGLTSAYTHVEHCSIITTARPEIMAHPICDSRSFTSMLDRATVLAIGPGLGRELWAETCFASMINSDKTKIIDADALWFLSKNALKSENWILTPHPKEAARLLGTTTNNVQMDRFAAIVQLQKQYKGIIVLKGAGTLIYDGIHPIQICTDGNPGMASAGMGDILTGLIAGLVAQHIPLFEAACLGVSLHAKAGDRCSQVCGTRGMLALDLLPYVRNLIN